MTKIALPQSWRDLSHAELVALLNHRLTFFSKADLLWAKYTVAQAKSDGARDAEQSAWQAEREAFDAWMGKRDSKSLAAYERAKASYQRDAAAMKRAEAREALLWRMCNAEMEA
ncbi:hypothetical protein ABE438_14560 [Bosea sp. TWI1241]|uniref:hypothetical protein n=1 Tax=Bosea sp. TWI1241 TaxID=3148904 RepID=UPI00320A3D41